MLESIKKISNPLTIIALFAGLAELGGTAVLPLLIPQTEVVYVWFLMIFPSVLVIFFFLTLNYNHKVLYAPSDYKDEDNFMKLFDKPTYEEKLTKLRTELDLEKANIEEDGEQDELNTDDSESQDLAADELKTEIPKVDLSETTNNSSIDVKEPSEIKDADDTSAAFSRVTKTTKIGQLKKKFSNTNYLIQDLALSKFSREFSYFEKEAMLRSKNNQYLFDAVARRENQTFAIEVHIIDNDSSLLKLQQLIDKFSRVIRDIKNIDSASINVLLVLIINQNNPNYNVYGSYARSYLVKLGIRTEVRTLSLDQLKNEIYNPS